MIVGLDSWGSSAVRRRAKGRVRLNCVRLSFLRGVKVRVLVLYASRVVRRRTIRSWVPDNVFFGFVRGCLLCGGRAPVPVFRRSGTGMKGVHVKISFLVVVLPGRTWLIQLFVQAVC